SGSYGSTSGSYGSTSGGYSGSASSSTIPTDTIVVTEIRRSLSGNTELAPIVSQLQITENNGTVTLSGRVPNEQQKQQIQTLVQQQTGVTQVNNQITVSSQSSA